MPGYESLSSTYGRIGFEKDKSTGRWVVGQTLLESPLDMYRSSASSASGSASSSQHRSALAAVELDCGSSMQPRMTHRCTSCGAIRAGDNRSTESVKKIDESRSEPLAVEIGSAASSRPSRRSNSCSTFSRADSAAGNVGPAGPIGHTKRHTTHVRTDNILARNLMRERFVKPRLSLC